jgi:tetratricopeptide (TPR) repeat protein
MEPQQQNLTLPSLSLCMIAKNEEHCIREAILSVSTLFSEFILVDTGSTDATVSIAEEFGAKVIHEQWVDDFSAHRNSSLAHASGEWILVLDADEVIDETQLPILRHLIAGEKKCYQFIQRHYTDDHRLSRFQPSRGQYPEREKHHIGFFDSWLCRLFPNDTRIRYENRVHELVEPAIQREQVFQLERAPILLHHYGNTAELIERKKKKGLYSLLGQRKLDEHPEEWKNFYELGIEHNTNGRLEESVECFEAALTRNPAYTNISINLGYVLTELGRFDESEKVLSSALQLAPKSAELLCNLAVNYMRQGRDALAVPLLKEAITIHSNYLNAYANLGSAYFRLGLLSEGTQVYQQGIAQAPRNVKMYERFAVSLLDVGKLREAKTVLEAVIQLASQQPSGWGLMALTLERLGLPKEALMARQKEQELLAVGDS